MHSSQAGHRCALCHVPVRYTAVRADPPVALSPVWTTGGEHGKDRQVIGNSTERVYITTEGDMLANLAGFFSGDSALARRANRPWACRECCGGRPGDAPAGTD